MLCSQHAQHEEVQMGGPVGVLVSQLEEPRIWKWQPVLIASHNLSRMMLI